jgi:thiol-disulfide isomerase/thioredoxin
MWIAALLLLTAHETDFNVAQKRAKAEKKAIVVDLWATWCHSCLSMQNYVLNTPEIQALEKQVVFVAIDTELEANKPIVDKFKPTAWPTFLVVDSSGNKVLSRLVGSATVSAFHTFVTSALAGKSKLIAQADDALTHGAKAEAEKLYVAALGDTKLSPSDIGRAATSLVSLYWQNGNLDLCATEGERWAKAAAGTYFAAGLRATAAECLMEKTPVNDKRLAALLTELEVHVKDTSLNVDDRSDLYATIASINEALGKKEARTEAILARIAMLEAAAKTAATPEAARTFDAHRTEAYLSLDRADDAIALLTESEKLAPNDYNPPARLANAYLKKGDLANARAAISRARAKVYGPRTAVILILQGDIEGKAGEKTKAKQAYEAAKAILSQQTKTLGVQLRLQQIEKKVGAL